MRAVFAALALVFSVAACSDITGPGQLTGTYQLDRVDGQRLPYVVDQTIGYRLELVASTLTLHRDETYSTSFTWRETTGGQSFTDTDHYTGTWSRSGDDLLLYDDYDGHLTEAYIDGRTLVVYDEGLTFEYR